MEKKLPLHITRFVQQLCSNKDKGGQFKLIFPAPYDTRPARRYFRSIVLLISITFWSVNLFCQQCPVTPCTVAHQTFIDIASVPYCGTGSLSLDGDVQPNQNDCQNGSLNCHEFIVYRPPLSLTQQFNLHVGQGSGCTGELDASFAYINGVCYQLSNGGSQTLITFTFPFNIDTIHLFFCINSGAHVSVCNLCAVPPPCTQLPECNLANINFQGCQANVPVAFTNPSSVFTNISTCAGISLVLSHTDVGDVSFCNSPAGVNFIRTYTLYFIDSNGDTIEFRQCVQSIKVTPTLPLAVCKNASVQLNSNGVATISPSLINNGSTLGCNGVLSAMPTNFTCANLGANIVTLKVTDDCGNTSTCTSTVTVTAPTPTADAGPANADVCNDATYTAAATSTNGTVLWTTSGTGSFNGTQTNEDAVYTPSAADIVAGTVVLTMTVTGTCTTASDMITLHFIQCACLIVLNCDNSVLRSGTINGCSTAAAPAPINPPNKVFDTLSIAGLNCNILYQEITSTSGSLCNNLTVTYTYYGWHDVIANGIRDIGEQQYTCTETFSIIDQSAPTITTCAAPRIIDGCSTGAITSPPYSETTVATTEGVFESTPNNGNTSDNCGVASVTYIDVAAGSCPIVVTRRWTVSDACGNSSTCIQTITVRDITPPVVTSGSIATCYPTVAAAEAAALAATSATDNCSGMITEAASTTGTCNAIVTVTETDACNNVNSVSYNTSIDNTSPLITLCAVTRTIEGCNTGVITSPPFSAGTAASTELVFESAPNNGNTSDNCGISSVTYSDVASGSCPIVVTRTWKISDACGNTSTCNQIINVNDTTSPIITFCPGSSTVNCGVTPVFGTPTAMDACDLSVSITPADVTIQGLCPGQYSIVRTWTAVDDCNNSATCSAMISVQDNTPPQIHCPSDLVLTCDAGQNYVALINAWIATATATDACDANVTITNNYDGMTVPDFSCQGGMVITFTAADDCGNTSTCSATVTKPCFTIESWVYLEGAAASPTGGTSYTIPMRTTLNDIRVLPGQTLVDPFAGNKYSPPGQPYSIAPWNYPGTEGSLFDSGGNPSNASAGYPATVVDWVLVSLRLDSAGTVGPVCQAAALLHKDGTIQFVKPLNCCGVIESTSYYVVIEHRNHLIVMSHVKASFISHKLSYDFRFQQSWEDPLFAGLNIFAREKEILPGKFAMYTSNGKQTGSLNADTDLNFDDRSFWETQNGAVGFYRIGDYNLNADTNFNDRIAWERNNGKFTSVPRN
ncbi:MAG: HYR domain-containing protein [Saprospiraceae bacterium]|uniref:HYR domain-containing protein n=1 Tax=Candidatus Opimibacter skivensis TaxID=2982028 RepID=A0A9D7XTX9_9BACT|nr:HYR domain-containing protein [Candidatus Opimibacter skivensis]